MGYTCLAYIPSWVIQVWHKNFIPNDSLNEPKKKVQTEKSFNFCQCFMMKKHE